MDAKVTLQDRMTFVGVADSGNSILIASRAEGGEEHNGPSPMELMAMSLASCTAMDVISVLRKKQQVVTTFEVRVHIDRAAEHPKVFTRAVLTYEVRGPEVDEMALRRAIELSALRYCPANAMLSKVFPIEFHYQIYKESGELVKEGAWEPLLTG